MGKICPDLVGAYRDTVGNAVYYVQSGTNYVRSKNKSAYKSNTPEQQKQRDKFSAMSHFAAVMKHVAKVGLPQRPAGITPRNYFHHLNKECCEATEQGVTIDYPKIICSKGFILAPNMTAVGDSETKAIVLTVKGVPKHSNSEPDDAIYAVVLEKEQEFCELVEVCKRGEGGTLTVQLTEDWMLEKVVVYAFATTALGKDTSRTLHISLE